MTKSYEYHNFFVFLDPGFRIGGVVTIDEEGNGYAEQWIKWTAIFNSDRFNIMLSVNDTGEVRQARMAVFDYNQEKHFLLSVVQNPK